MNNKYEDSIILDLMREVQSLKKELDGLKTSKPPFFVMNLHTPATLTADMDNYDPGNYDILRLVSDASRTITGISGGVAGRFLYLRNVGSQNIVLAHNSASSDATNRIFLLTAANRTMTPGTNGSNSTILLFYTGSVWGELLNSSP